MAISDFPRGPRTTSPSGVTTPATACLLWSSLFGRIASDTAQPQKSPTLIPINPAALRAFIRLVAFIFSFCGTFGGQSIFRYAPFAFHWANIAQMDASLEPLRRMPFDGSHAPVCSRHRLGSRGQLRHGLAFREAAHGPRPYRIEDRSHLLFGFLFAQYAAIAVFSAFETNPWPLILINMGRPLLAFAVSGIVLGAWRLREP